jgi:hypothetical protein
MKEEPSLKQLAYCLKAGKKVTHIFNIREGFLLKCDECENSFVVCSADEVLCGMCYGPCTVYKNTNYDDKFLGSYLSCSKCCGKKAESSFLIQPTKLDNSALECSPCKEYGRHGSLKSEKTEWVSATCLFCGRKTSIPGRKIMDVFSASCKVCRSETDWIETDSCLMCLTCGNIWRK